MKHIKTRENGHSITNNYTAERWSLIVPKILKEFWKDGTRFYKTDDGKIYDANVYDEKLAPQLSYKRKFK
jgi:hypothetical protein